MNLTAVIKKLSLYREKKGLQNSRHSSYTLVSVLCEHSLAPLSVLAVLLFGGSTGRKGISQIFTSSQILRQERIMQICSALLLKLFFIPFIYVY